MDLKGIVTVINTPFDHSGGIDKDGLRKHLRYAINSGVKGFLIPAMASEVLKLSESEKELLVKIALEGQGQMLLLLQGLLHIRAKNDTKILSNSRRWDAGLC